MNGKLVTFSGIIGSAGEVTALISRLKSVFSSQGLTVAECMTPDSGRVDVLGAANIPGLNLGENKQADFFEECKGRKKVCTSIIEPGLKYGDLVLCRHFTLDSRVNMLLNFPEADFEELKVAEALSRGFNEAKRIEADLVIFIDVPSAVALERARDRGDCYPKKIKFYRDMSVLYHQEIKAFENHLIIDGILPLDEIFEKAYWAIKTLLENR